MTHFNLSDRKIEVMKYAAQGMSYKEIAENMCLSHDTIKSHVYQALEITGCRNTTELVYKLSKEGKI